MTFLRHDVPYDAIPFLGESWPWCGGDLQTLRNVFLRQDPALAPGARWEIDVSDGDKLVGFYHEASQPVAMLVIIHGLAGDSESSYIKKLTHHALAHQISVLRVNLRGAGAGRPLAKGAYHAGRSDDLEAVISAMTQAYPGRPCFMTAFSLGGAMALNLVARHQSITSYLAGLVTFCAPFDMVACAARFHRWRNTPYIRHFTSSLKAQAKAAPAADPALIAKLNKVTTVRQFDDVFTAPAAGYANADAYYEGTSTHELLDDLQVPTLLVHSDNDPWIGVEAYQQVRCHERLHCLITKGGGHVGFHDRETRNRCWQSHIAVQFITHQLMGLNREG